MSNRLTSTLDFQAQALTLRSERQRLIASNIANADTPGYVARDMDFAKALRDATREATSAASSSGAGNLATSQGGHIAARSAMNAGANLVYSLASQSSLDGNSVDMDRERAAFADNTVKYEATLRFITSDVRNMLDAIKGGN